MLLYHGTSERHLEAILRDGIKPRGKKGRGNWKHSVESNPSCVYLTTAYPIYFAGSAVRDDGRERLAVVEVDADDLDLFALLPDEDFLEQVSRKGGPAPTNRPMKYRTRWYRQRLREFSQYWQASIDGMGTCCYWGTLPAEAITRVALLDHDAHMRLIMHGMDPMISVANFQYCQHKYRNYTHWLFGDPLEEDPTDLTSKLNAEQFAELPEEMRKVIVAHKKYVIDRAGVEIRAINSAEGRTPT